MNRMPTQEPVPFALPCHALSATRFAFTERLKFGKRKIIVLSIIYLITGIIMLWLLISFVLSGFGVGGGTHYALSVFLFMIYIGVLASALMHMRRSYLRVRYDERWIVFDATRRCIVEYGAPIVPTDELRAHPMRDCALRKSTLVLDNTSWSGFAAVLVGPQLLFVLAADKHEENINKYIVLLPSAMRDLYIDANYSIVGIGDVLVLK